MVALQFSFLTLNFEGHMIEMYLKLYQVKQKTSSVFRLCAAISATHKCRLHPTGAICAPPIMGVSQNNRTFINAEVTCISDFYLEDQINLVKFGAFYKVLSSGCQKCDIMC